MSSEQVDFTAGLMFHITPCALLPSDQAAYARSGFTGRLEDLQCLSHGFPQIKFFEA